MLLATKSINERDGELRQTTVHVEKRRVMTMTAAAAVADDGSVRELKRREAELTEQICRLKSKLLLYDETAAERDELRAQLDDVRRWTRELVDDERQLHGELQRDLEAQVSALETAERDRTALDVENRRLADINERIADQLTAVRDNEKRLTVEIDLLEVAKRRALDELECAQVHPSPPPAPLLTVFPTVVG